MAYLNELKDSGLGAIGVKEETAARKLITERWEQTQMLDGLKGQVKENIAQLMENQLTSMLHESTDAVNSGSYETVAFPIIRRIFSKLLANDIVSIQTMSQPVGRLYYINPIISVRDSFGHNSVMDGAFSNAATTPAGNKVQFSQTSLYDSFFATDAYSEANGLFDASKGAITLITGTTIASGITSGANSAIVAITGFQLTPERGTMSGPTGNIMDTEEFLANFALITTGVLTDAYNGTNTKNSGDTVLFNVKPQIYGQAIVDNTNTLLLQVDLTYPTTNGLYTGYSWTTTPVFKYAYRQYSNLEEDSEMSEVSFRLDNVTVEASTRKLRAVWTPELAQDVNAFHNIDAEAELTALLSEEMALEIDREILRDLRRGAAWVSRWDYNGLRKTPNAVGLTQKDWNQTLITKVNQISAQIMKSTLRGAASWIVVSPEISAVFDDLQYFQVNDASAESYKYNLGIEKIGTLQGRYSVIVDPYAPSNVLLVGHKGSSLLETGYIYSPYVPMTLTPVVYNFHNFSSVRGIITRYAKKMIFNKFFGKVNCDGIISFNPSF